MLAALRPKSLVASLLIGAALAAGAAVVLLTHVLEQPVLLPLRLGDDLKLLRPRFREDFGIVDRDRVGDRRRALPPQALDRVQRVAVHAELLPVRVVVIVERPAL